MQEQHAHLHKATQQQQVHAPTHNAVAGTRVTPCVLPLSPDATYLSTPPVRITDIHLMSHTADDYENEDVLYRPNQVFRPPALLPTLSVP